MNSKRMFEINGNLVAVLNYDNFENLFAKYAIDLLSCLVKKL